MRICKKHWDMCRESVKSRGLEELVASSGEEAMSRQVDELNGGDMKKNFDPLMSMHWHWTSAALRCGGLYLMGENEDGNNEGRYCPLCEFEKHQEGFNSQLEIDGVADQMRAWCIEEKLIAAPN